MTDTPAPVTPRTDDIDDAIQYAIAFMNDPEGLAASREEWRDRLREALHAYREREAAAPAATEALRAALERLMELWKLPWTEKRYGEAQIILSQLRALEPPLPSRSCRHGINPDECEFCDSPGADKEEATRQAIRLREREAAAPAATEALRAALAAWLDWYEHMNDYDAPDPVLVAETRAALASPEPTPLVTPSDIGDYEIQEGPRFGKRDHRPTPDSGLDVTRLRKALVNLDRILPGGQRPMAAQIAAEYARLSSTDPSEEDDRTYTEDEYIDYGVVQYRRGFAQAKYEAEHPLPEPTHD